MSKNNINVEVNKIRHVMKIFSFIFSQAKNNAKNHKKIFRAICTDDDDDGE